MRASLLRDVAVRRSHAAEVSVGWLGDGQHRAGPLGAVHLLLGIAGRTPSLALDVRVVLDGELQQPAGLLDQQIDLVGILGS